MCLSLHVPEKWKHLASSDYKVGGKSIAGLALSILPPISGIAGKKPGTRFEAHALMGKHSAAQEWLRLSGRMDERYDMVRQL